VMEVILNSSRYIAEQMGLVMRNAAFSPNIKDRLDMSTALADSKGRIVAQAEHIPVHLGSLAVAISRIVKDAGEIREGDVIVTNDPYVAGTHLNDVTMISPVEYRGEIAAVVASKAHYVDIGGSSPGSLSASATDLYQEGLIVPPLKIAEGWVVDVDFLRLISSNSRVGDHVVADVHAQVSSLRFGVMRVKDLFSKYGDRVLQEWENSVDYVRNYTGEVFQSKLEVGEYWAEDFIELNERDLRIRVRIEARERSVLLDFTGTDPQVSYPVNAVYGVTVASSLFALKAALDPEMPFNHGFLDLVEFRVPEGSLVNSVRPAPVSAGNVETSQRIADVVLKALSTKLDLPAASQGTMNNVMLGGEDWAFYETVGGGSGGRPTGDGVDGVHTNMTNTLNTPVEVIERYYPLRVVRYSLREDSCGAGEFRGGLGLVREIEVLRDCTVTIVGDRVRRGPWGIKGGMPGSPAKYTISMEGREVELGSKASIKLKSGGRVTVMSPGGGGYGDPSRRAPELLERDELDGKVSRCFRRTP
jgi:N-methylhydantoinase B